ncbi:MAG TPA: ABC transporter permease subunit [Candidatus Nanopelagicales bacterium]|nr:ABC transporter permease subunit [Candidatus Nanopelagicales bacterium]
MSGGWTFFVSDLRLRTRSLLWWSLGIVALVVLVDAFYPSIAGDPALDQMMAELPEALRPLLGPDDLTSPIGYLSSQLYLFFLPTVILVYGIGRGTSAIAGEEEDHTLDLLLAQPVSRTSLYVQKVAGVVFGIMVLSVVSLLPTLILAGPTGLDIPVQALVSVTVQMVAFLLVFSLLAMSVSAAFGRKGIGIALSAGLAFATFLIDGLGQSIDWLEPVRDLTPWRWYDATAAMNEGFLPGQLALLVLVAAVVAVGGLIAFRRRNLRS